MRIALYIYILLIGVANLLVLDGFKYSAVVFSAILFACYGMVQFFFDRKWVTVVLFFLLILYGFFMLSNLFMELTYTIFPEEKYDPPIQTYGGWQALFSYVLGLLVSVGVMLKGGRKLNRKIGLLYAGVVLITILPYLLLIL